MRKTSLIASFVLIGWLGVSTFPLVVEAVREGTSNANIMIRRYERHAQFGKAALWHETAAKCLEIISKPLAQISLEYAGRLGIKDGIPQLKAELVDIERQRQGHLQKVQEDRTRAEETPVDLEIERAKIQAFMAEWVSYYPAHFYDFGVYRRWFGSRVKELKRARKFQKALLVEAEAAEMLAREYEDVTLRFFEAQACQTRQTKDPQTAQKWDAQAAVYRKVRDSHLQRAARLRALARRPLGSWPEEADIHETLSPETRHRLTPQQAIRKANSDPRVRHLLEGKEAVRSFAWFQGFAWTVSYYAAGWDNLAIVFLDDRTEHVTDLLLNPGNLEDDQRRTSEEESMEDEAEE